MNNQDLTKNNQGSNQGDLISRSALKKAFEDTVCIEPMPYAFVKQIIDNAPLIGIPIRYKGEWIEREQKTMGAIISYNVCSYCHMKQSIKWNFCPDCGADMRGDAE